MAPRILLIEDNEQNRYLMTFLLERAGFAVEQADTGKAGLEHAAREIFALVLLDIQLPGIDGYAVTRAFRALPGWAHVPIVACTSYSMAGDREKALDAGCDAHLEKPIDPETFVSEIRSYVRPRAGEGPTP